MLFRSGKAMNLASLIASDMLYSDHHDEVIPIPVLRSYSEGLSPEEYWAGTYGARRGIMSTKFATQEAGFLSKQLNQAGHRLVVMGEEPDETPDAPLRGMIADTDPVRPRKCATSPASSPTAAMTNSRARGTCRTWNSPRRSIKSC